MAIIDSYEDSNASQTTNVSTTLYGQSFLNASSVTLRSIAFKLSAAVSIEGPIVARLYAHTGVFGTSSEPTGAALATSEELYSDDIGVSARWWAFNIPGGYSLSASTHYCVAIQPVATLPTSVFVRVQNSSPTHAGNYFTSTNGGSTWTPASTSDLAFILYDVYITNLKPTGAFYLRQGFQ